jgi:glycosyltransferase involved in cell wall biosynthesis
MKIIYITEQIYIHGGAEKILTQKLNHWADVKNYSVLLITSEQNQKESCYPLSKKIKHVDLDVGYNRSISYFKIENLLKFPKHYKKLKLEIHNFKPDAIFLISLSWIRFVLPILASKYHIYNEYHTSYFGFEMGVNELSFLGKIKKRISDILIKISESFYTNIVFLNQYEYDHYNRKNGVIIPNFFDKNISNVTKSKKNQIISLGRLNHQKGYDLLIDTWIYLDKQISDWTLKIYGNGPDKNKLSEKINNYSFKNNIEVNEAVSDVSEILAESNIYVMSSRFETFPMVLLEALSNGLPVVSFDCPTGPKSILINDQDGLLAKPNDTVDLANKILSLINNNELRKTMSLNAKINIKRFSEDFVMNKWDQLIKRNLDAEN